MITELKTSGLPIYLDVTTCNLEFRDNLTCAGSVSRTAGQLKGLLCADPVPDENEPCYSAYRDIAFEGDRVVFQQHDFRYDITVIQPGTIAGECKKTSGHYHGYIPGQANTYPEVYEVLLGQAIFILQKVMNFDREEEPVIDDLKAVFVEAGQAIIIPPFYGHCSINAGTGPLVFSNIAVVSCPIHYEPIRRKHGLAVYAQREGDVVNLIPNPYYQHVPTPQRVLPKENPALGITFGRPVYESFLQDSEKFEFLIHPAAYESEMRLMLDQIIP